MSRDVRKPDFCICENKDTDQLRGNREADQRLCFRHLDRSTPLLPKFENFKSLASFSNCAARFVSDLDGNPEDWFSDVAAHIKPLYSTVPLVSIPEILGRHRLFHFTPIYNILWFLPAVKMIVFIWKIWHFST